MKNIGKRHAALRQVVSKTMQDYLIKGHNPTDAIPILRREFGYSAKSAKRLLVTEGARVASQMQKYSFEKYGYEEYEYIAEPKACDICKPLNGKIFKVKEMMPGENAAPMHPHCRCSVAAHYSEEKEAEVKKEDFEEPFQELTRLYRNKDLNKRRPINIVRQNKLTASFRNRGGIVHQSEETDLYLKKQGAAAINYDAHTILIQTKPTISEVLEELFHAEQWRDGRLKDDPVIKIKAEIEAQNYLLSVEKRYNIPESETKQTRENLRYWERRLKEVLEDENSRH